MSELPYRPNVGLLLANKAGLIFCGERNDTPGAWQMPQGGIDAGEEPRAAALRELAEEVGTQAATIVAESAALHRYDFPPHLQRHEVFRGAYRGQEQRWFLLRFTGQDADIRLDAHAEERGPEFRAWRWMTRKEVLAHAVPFKRPVYAAVLEEFAPLLRG